MTTHALNRMRRPLRRRAQRGVVLFIALIVLVAMSLAGIAIMRSVDTGNLISGNVAFKQGTLASADRGIDTAFKYLKDNAAGDYLWINQEADAYFAQADEPDWAEDSTWDAAKVVGTDAAGNTIEYMIHRMCEGAGKYTDTNCAQTPRTGGQAGNSMSVLGNQFTATPVVYYRVTVRVEGPRDTMSIVQSNIGIQQ